MEGEITFKNKCDSAILFYSYKVVKNEHDQLSLEIFVPTIRSNKCFKD